MDTRKFLKKDLQLKRDIAEHQMRVHDMEAQIAIDKREIARIDFEIAELHTKYSLSMEQ